jgi:hypothetical protein
MPSELENIFTNETHSNPYRNIAAKPPAIAAKLKVMEAPAALETVAGGEVVEVPVGLDMLPEAELVIVAFPGSMVALYDAQVALGERGQVLSMQIA